MGPHCMSWRPVRRFLVSSLWTWFDSRSSERMTGALGSWAQAIKLPVNGLPVEVAPRHLGNSASKLESLGRDGRPAERIAGHRPTAQGAKEICIDSSRDGRVVYKVMLRALAHHHHHRLSYPVACQWANA